MLIVETRPVGVDINFAAFTGGEGFKFFVERLSREFESLLVLVALPFEFATMELALKLRYHSSAKS